MTSILFCPRCKTSIKLIKSGRIVSHYSCNCQQYFSILDIFCFYSEDQMVSKIIQLSNKPLPLQLLGFFFTFKRLFLATVIASIFRNIQITIYIFQFFGLFDKLWSNYLLERQYSTSQIIATKVATSQKVEVAVDAGCGCGHLLPHFRAKKIIGLDISLVNLLVARISFSSPKFQLVCADLSQPLPLKTASVDALICCETLQYLKPKLQKSLIGEFGRIVSSSGQLALIHQHKYDIASDFCRIYGADQNTICNLFKQSDFKTVISEANHLTWSKIVDQNKYQNLLAKTYFDTDIYNYFASKSDALVFKLKPARQFFSKLRLQGDKLLLDRLKTNALINKFSHFIFISPHFDDAVLSCGNLLEILKLNHKKISIITVFTKGLIQEEYSPEAKYFLDHCLIHDPIKLFNARINEDRKANKLFNAKSVHLDYIDAAFRTKIVDPKDKLDRVIQKIRDRKIILAPLGTGDHPDHKIIHNYVINQKFPYIFWSDFPYNRNNLDYRPKNFASITIPPNPNPNNLKLQAIYCHKTQLNLLFPDHDLKNEAERYYLKPDLINSI